MNSNEKGTKTDYQNVGQRIEGDASSKLFFYIAEM